MTVEELEELTNSELVELRRKTLHDKKYEDLNTIYYEMACRFEWMLDDELIPADWTMKENLPKF